MSKWNPDEHLPECGVTRYPICICDRLRDCEKRVREDEREQARQRVLDAAEHNVKIKGITVAVIQRSVAAQAAEGAA